MSTRGQDEFRDALARSITFDDMRLMDVRSLARVADADAVAKCRIRVFHDQSRAIEKMTISSGDYDDMEKARDSWRPAGTGFDARDFALSDNVAMIYFNAYGENFEGGEIPDDANAGWECPACHLKYKVSLKTLPDNCLRCGWQTPLGRLRQDGVLRR